MPDKSSYRNVAMGLWFGIFLNGRNLFGSGFYQTDVGLLSHRCNVAGIVQ